MVDHIWSEEEDILVDGMTGLALIYNGKEVEGEIVNIAIPKPKVMRDVIFALDGKKYKFTVEEIQD